MPTIYNPIFFAYELACTWPGCTGTLKIEQATSAGWKTGQMVPEDRSHPEVGRCPKCKRNKMKVAVEPPQPPSIQPHGWNKIPTE